MATANVVYLHGLQREDEPIECTVALRFYAGKVAYKIYGTTESISDNKALADVFEALAAELKDTG